MFCLHARIPLQLDCESWDGALSLDLAGFVVVELISAQEARLFACASGMVYVIIFSPPTLHRASWMHLLSTWLFQ